ncbi:ABC transporter substrate-binding protein, partial [Nocardioides sp.]|uniref:ABC transporter substrate-binding protein n=1 Tax=Nocardioides sp. TaxID=35761 RepID=UPI002736454D
MRRTRTILTAVSALSALSLGLVACGGDSASSESESGGPITLTVATFNEFGYDALLKEYDAAHDDITVKHTKADVADNARNALRSSLGANSGAADIEAVEVDWLTEFMQYPDKFADLASDDVEGRWLDWKTEAATTEDGKLIGYGTDIGPEAVCYRADLLEEAGLPSEREEFAAFIGDTWESYFEAGKEFVEKSDAAWYDSAGALWQGVINQVEVPYEEPDGTVIAAENPEIKGLYEQVLQASTTDGLSAGLGQWSQDWSDAFQRSSFATMLCPGWMLGVIEGNAT